MARKPKEFQAFYSSGAWARCAAAYMSSQQNLCEECRAMGRAVPAVEVHHKVKLSAENIGDDSITLGWDNLQALCRAHHEAKHSSRRWTVDENGDVFIIGE